MMKLDTVLGHRGVLTAAILVIAAGLAFAAGAGYTGGLVGDSSTSVDGSSTYEAAAWVNHITVKKNGEVIWTGTNTLTDQGQQWLMVQVSNLTVDDITNDKSTSFNLLEDNTLGLQAEN
ncbi:MAG: hypothetical protein SVU32_04175, partial [Candidatus Nanohaloarchaea archaeon]|nr:hypothetical protein [Candidatus Nanohaloarchaea archaeon]